MVEVGKLLLAAAHPSLHCDVCIHEHALVCLCNLSLGEVILASCLVLHILMLLCFYAFLSKLKLVEELCSADLTTLVFVNDCKEFLNSLQILYHQTLLKVENLFFQFIKTDLARAI